MLNSFIGLSNRSKHYKSAGYTKRRCDEIKDHVTEFVQIFGSKIQDFLPFFKTFSRSRKSLGKFQDFFSSSRLCTNRDVKGCLPGDMNRHCSVDIECNLGY